MPESEIRNIHERMDKQDGLLKEIRDMLIGHLATEKEMKPALTPMRTRTGCARKMSMPARWRCTFLQDSR